MSVNQVVTRQIHRGMMHGVNEVGLHHGIVGMLHRIGCVDYIHLESKKQKHACMRSQNAVDRSEMLSYKNASVTFRHYLHSSVVNASVM